MLRPFGNQNHMISQQIFIRLCETCQDANGFCYGTFALEDRKTIGTFSLIIMLKMDKKFLKLLVCFALFSSCSKEVEMCVSGDLNPETTGPQTYTWCGENAVELLWHFNGVYYEGNSVTLNFPVVEIYDFSLQAKGKKDRKTEYFSVTVGKKQAHIEPLDCETNWYINNSGSYRAYLFQNRDQFQDNYRSGLWDNCMDSVDLAKDLNYGGDVGNTSARWNGRFDEVDPGSYFVFVQDVSNTNYLTNLMYGGNTNLTITDEHKSDDALIYFNLHNSPEDNHFLRNLFSKTFSLTNVVVNSVDVGVASCNADDELIFNLDGTWELNAGSDDCGGTQTNSTGTMDYGIFCSNNMFVYPNSGETTFGTFPPYFSFTRISEISFKITYQSGLDTTEEIYTVQ